MRPLNHESLLTPTKLRQVSLNQLSARAPRVLDHWSPRRLHPARQIPYAHRKILLYCSKVSDARGLMYSPTLFDFISLCQWQSREAGRKSKPEGTAYVSVVRSGRAISRGSDFYVATLFSLDANSRHASTSQCDPRKFRFTVSQFRTYESRSRRPQRKRL